jgi:hypothetical protein
MRTHFLMRTGWFRARDDTVLDDCGNEHSPPPPLGVHDEAHGRAPGTGNRNGQGVVPRQPMNRRGCDRLLEIDQDDSLEARGAYPNFEHASDPAGQPYQRLHVAS